MWVWYLLLGSGTGSSVESQFLPGNNFTTECNIPGNFMCGNGLCIPGNWQCDGVPDCLDRSDEKGCSKVRIQMRPPPSSPVPAACTASSDAFRCNGFRDCPDGSDEDNCTGNPLVCSSSRFPCRNGRCVDRSFLCNGHDNCQDNSDEENCLSTAESPGQDFVTLDYRLHYYPSITYAVIGSAVIFVLVVSLLALVLHHQRKRSMLLPRTSRGGHHHHHHHQNHHQNHQNPHHQSQQQPLLLSRLVIVDRAHMHAAGTRLPIVSSGPFNSAQSLQLLTSALYSRGSPLDSPPSYSQAVLDVSRPPWFDLPPPPYPPDAEHVSGREPPLYEAPTDGPGSDTPVSEAAQTTGQLHAGGPASTEEESQQL
ncbi:low-density lipoprotein receptor class A domain-containing protein 3 [Brachyhypopomus gauderio]|uniref:low-density lipoprotein receptor class A domain-containing protein 3 n=1 Tax=Brachyhypopomus gauderio TaxID=698409 RepID=UPI0040420309